MTGARPVTSCRRICQRRDGAAVYWTSAAAKAATTCIGNQSVPQHLHLHEPLGDRVLLDGSSCPRPIANLR
jgi:hypothetical protein